MIKHEEKMGREDRSKIKQERERRKEKGEIEIIRKDRKKEKE